MSQIYKNITSLSLLLVGLVMLAHSFIPHDHHYSFYSESQHHHQKQDNHSSEYPFHCYSFNEVHFNKIRTSSFTKSIKVLPVNAVDNLSHSFIINLYFPTKKINGTETHFLDYTALIHISPTRGSPLV